MKIDGFRGHKYLIDNVISPQITFNDGVSYDSWKNEIKSKFLELIGYERIKQNDCPLNIQIEEDSDKGDYRQIRFVIESEREEFVPCYLLIPSTGKDKYPVAITLQGHSTGFHNSIGVKKFPQDEDYHPRGQFALQAVKNGYIALAIEQRGMGERRPSERHQNGANMCEHTAHIALLLGRTILGERMWDVSKAIDALSNFPQCDLDKILITGNSGGGTMSYYAACFDERIKLSVPSCAFCTYKDSIMNWFHCSCNFIPHSYEWFEMHDLSCLIAPRKLVVIAGKEDNIFPIYGVRAGYEVIEKIYAKAGFSDNCQMIETPKAHWWCEDIVWDAINTETKKLGW